MDTSTLRWVQPRRAFIPVLQNDTSTLSSRSSSQLGLNLGRLVARCRPLAARRRSARRLSRSLCLVLRQKLWELAKQVSEFLVWRQVICPFERDRRILQYLVTTPVFSEDGQSRSSSSLGIVNEICVTDSVCSAAELHLASYDSEGPENNLEKDSRRSLR